MDTKNLLVLSEKNNNSIAVGIVLYNPEISRLIEVITSVNKQFDKIIMYDNASNNINQIKIIADNYNIDLLENNSNNGIAYALNRILEYAKSLGYLNVITLDHDTVCPQNMLYEYNKLIDEQNAKFICPNVIDREIVNNKYYNDTSQDFVIVKQCIQAGFLINIEVWKDIGKFDESLFIDFVDFDFCKRIEISGNEIYCCTKVTIDHELGHREKTRFYKVYAWLFEFLKLNIFKYLQYKNIFSAQRAYYSARNNLIYIKKYSNYVDVTLEIKKMLIRIFKRVLRGKNSLKILLYSLRGIKDAIKYKVEYHE